MNWKKIKKDYPKSYSELEGIGISGSVWDRSLYDFFDENEMIIIIDYDFHDGVFLWKFDITYGCGTMYESAAQYTDRNKAEQAAFEKAFEILENKLTL